MEAMKISGHGISLNLPAAWEGRIYQRPQGFPIVHAGSFALPADDADFGSGAIIAVFDSRRRCRLLRIGLSTQRR